MACTSPSSWAAEIRWSWPLAALAVALAVVAVDWTAPPAMAQDVPEFTLGIQRDVPLLRLGLGGLVVRDEQGTRSPAREQRLWKVLREDLTFTGVFDVVDVRGTAEGRGQDQPPPVPPELGRLDARATVSILVDPARREASLTGYLFDGPTDRLIAGKRYRAGESLLRRMAHLFADEIMRLLTGERGSAHALIAYTSTASGHKELFLMDYDGEDARQLTAHGNIVMSPSFAPDGRRIAFVSYASGYPEVYIYDVQAGRSRQVTKGKALVSAPSFSPDGRYLVFAASTEKDEAEVFELDLATGRRQQLTFQRGIDTSPVYSANGREIAFTSNRSGSPQIWIMDRDGTNARRLTFYGAYNTSATWSPKGDLIAYAGRVAGAFQLFTIRPDGSGLRQLTAGAGNKEDPAFSPDGRHLAFSTSEYGPYRIALIRIDGSGRRVVSSGRGEHTAPSWSP